MSNARVNLTPEAQQFLANTFLKNRSVFGDLRMEATDGGDGTRDAGDKSGNDQDKDGDKDGDKGDPKPTETLDYWKKRSRENEKRAKDNAEAAKEYTKLQEAQKTEEQKRLDNDVKQKQEAESLRLENIRLRAAGTHSVSGEDKEGVSYADLISGTDEDSVKQSAEAIGRLVAAAKERDSLQERLDALEKGRPVTGRPQGSLRSGATPPGDPAGPKGAGGISEAERRFGKTDNTK